MPLDGRRPACKFRDHLRLGSGVPPQPSTDRSPSRDAPSALLAIAVLTGMNLLNYIDRYVASAVKELFKHDLHFTDLQTSVPFTGLIVVYMLASPVFSSLSDRFSRKRLIAAGFAVWLVRSRPAAAATVSSSGERGALQL